MTTVTFAKVEAAENDFVVLCDPPPVDLAAFARRACHRRRGIGADGLAVLTRRDQRWHLRIVNADGSFAETSGNGTRCAVRYLLDRGLVTGDSLTVITGAGPVRARARGALITVDMGPPRFSGPGLPDAAGDGRPATAVTLRAAGRRREGWPVSMGNPHLVVRLDADEPLTAFPLEDLAAAARDGAGFPGGVNVEVVRWSGGDRASARVHERGVGETRSCGSGACAVAAALIAGAGAPETLTVEMPGGELVASWDGDPAHGVQLSGRAEQAFEGRVVW